MRRPSLALLTALPFALALPLIHCSPPPDSTVLLDGGADASEDGGAVVEEPDLPLVPADKVDVLFVVDDSKTMADKSAILATSARALLERLVRPRCVDAEDRGKVLGTSEGGACAQGVLEHAPIDDLHVGVITTSLGDGGANNVCAGVDNARENQRAHLQTRGPNLEPVASAEKHGFIAYSSKGDPQAGAVTTLDQLTTDVRSVLAGVGQSGCGLEAQLESMYRFLVQPDPPAAITLSETGSARYEGVDDELLAQRKAFLRPDSAVVVVLLTDEDDSNVDPRSLAGQGWSYASTYFPASDTYRARGYYTSGSEQDAAKGTTAPRGSSACEKDPTSPDCTSCGFAKQVCASDPSSEACKKLSADAACKAPAYTGSWAKTDADGKTVNVDLAEVTKGYHPGEADDLNVRFFDMKRRFGVDPRYPVERYVRGLSSRTAPHRDSEHDTGGSYVHAASCTNPLFAAELPSSSQAELCKLKEGTRSRRLVSFHLIGGLPPELAKVAPSGDDWVRLLGADPERYDASGRDVRMAPSIAKRVDPATRQALRDDWDTKGLDLQYACTFDLPEPRDCTPIGAAPPEGCQCGGSSLGAPVLCDGNTQLRARAYPAVRPLQLAKALGERAGVSSICGLDGQKSYARSLHQLADRIAPLLAK